MPLLILLWTLASSIHPARAEGGLEVSEGLRSHVDFWVRVYTEHTSQQGFVHDAKYLDKVYEIVDLRGRTGKLSDLMIASRRKWQQVLLSVHEKTQKISASTIPTFTDEESRVFQMYRDLDEPDRFLRAAHRKRIRFQLGQKDKFKESLIASGRFLPAMEEVFKAKGVPVELTRIPFVESSFNVRAKSKVGASGVWQFIPSTGRMFLKINDQVDERNDPIRATEAAADLLKLNFESLHHWPLAVTAYNHGRKGLMRAVRKTGSDDLAELVQDYRTRSFGFASSNYYASVIAAVEVEKQATRYYGDVKREAPWRAYEYVLPMEINLKVAARLLKLKLGTLVELNPGLSDRILKGKARVPVGYALRLPLDEGQNPEFARRLLAGVLEKYGRKSFR